MIYDATRISNAKSINQLNSNFPMFTRNAFFASLYATVEEQTLKLYSLTKRGQAYHMPMEIQNNFLAK